MKLFRWSCYFILYILYYKHVAVIPLATGATILSVSTDHGGPSGVRTYVRLYVSKYVSSARMAMIDLMHAVKTTLRDNCMSINENWHADNLGRHVRACFQVCVC